MPTQKIIPYLWFESKAEEAVDFYVSLFSGSKLRQISTYGEAAAEISGRAKNSVMTLQFELAGQKFLAINGGPVHKFTPAISFLVSCLTEAEIDYLYENLSRGGRVLVKFARYPFAEKYAWVNDKYGVSWQLALSKISQKITPVLTFSKNQRGRAEEAMNFYVDIFKHRGEESEIENVVYYGVKGKTRKRKVSQGAFKLAKQEFVAMDSSEESDFTFTSAVSFLIDCKNQEEINYFWEKFRLSGKPGKCGWVEDKFGVSWQVIPSILGELISDPDRAVRERVTRAMLQMKKMNIEFLKKAYANMI